MRYILAALFAASLFFSPVVFAGGESDFSDYEDGDFGPGDAPQGADPDDWDFSPEVPTFQDYPPEIEWDFDLGHPPPDPDYAAPPGSIMTLSLRDCRQLARYDARSYFNCIAIYSNDGVEGE